MIREDILNTAKNCVCRDRNTQYGEPENTFDDIANLWSYYLRIVVTPTDVAMLMALLKIARARVNKGHLDNFVDIAGYAACAGELAVNEEIEKER